MALCTLLLILAACESTPANTPTPTVEPCPTQAEQVYIDQLEEHINALGYAFIGLGELFAELEDNPLLVYDDDWKLDAGTEMAKMQSNGAAILELDAPPSVDSISFHAELLAGNVTGITDYYTVGIDNVDPALIEAGNAFVNAATVQLEEIPQAVLALCEGS